MCVSKKMAARPQQQQLQRGQQPPSKKRHFTVWVADVMQFSGPESFMPLLMSNRKLSKIASHHISIRNRDHRPIANDDDDVFEAPAPPVFSIGDWVADVMKFSGPETFMPLLMSNRELSKIASHHISIRYADRL